MATFTQLHTYPKSVFLRDETQVVLRPLEEGDKIHLLRFFEQVPEGDRYYLKENVTSPEVIRRWTTDIDFERVIPIVALVGDEIVADATLHRSRAMTRRHLGELRIVVDPRYREKGLGGRLIRELVDIAADLGLYKLTFELVARREAPAIAAAGSEGFIEVATLKDWISDEWGNYQDLVLMELSMKDLERWWRF